jgi:CheY-like chemotaxis protein
MPQDVANEVRVLVVDDQPVAREALGAVVEETDGFVVVAFAGSGEEALEYAARLRPDLVLMDLNLPGIDGADAARRLAGEVVVVLLSTYDEQDVAHRVAGSGAVYVPKGRFGPEALKAVWRPASG